MQIDRQQLRLAEISSMEQLKLRGKIGFLLIEEWHVHSKQTCQ